MILILLLMFAPPAAALIVGLVLRSNGKIKVAKVCFILAGLYLLISLGTCGYLLATFELH